MGGISEGEVGLSNKHGLSCRCLCSEMDFLGALLCQRSRSSLPDLQSHSDNVGLPRIFALRIHLWLYRCWAGSAGIIGWVLAADLVAERIANFILEISRNPYLFLFLTNIFYLIVGCLMEPAAAILLTFPLLLPLAEKVGVHPLHFGLVVVVNMCIGFITPPVGLCLYVLCGITKQPLERISRAVLPFLTVEILALALITYVPYLTLVLPRLVGLIQ